MTMEQITALRHSIYNALEPVLGDTFKRCGLNELQRDKLNAEFTDIIVRDLDAILRIYETYLSTKEPADDASHDAR